MHNSNCSRRTITRRADTAGTAAVTEFGSVCSAESRRDVTTAFAAAYTLIGTPTGRIA
jgi:hypothetical protein